MSIRLTVRQVPRFFALQQPSAPDSAILDAIFIPLAGSLTEMRGQKANMHVLREMLELCQIIDSEGYNVKDEPTMRVIPFGELFNIYNYISDKVVGILLRARKHKLVDFEGEMLFQRRDDDVPVFLLKPIAEIRQELQAKIEDIKRGGSPAPQATSVLLDKNAHKQKLSSRSSTPSASPTPSKTATPAQSKAASPVPSKASSPAPSEKVPAVTAAAAQQQTVTEVVEPNSEVIRLDSAQESSKPAEKTDAAAAATPAVAAQSVEQPALAAEKVEAPVQTNPAADIPNPNAIKSAEIPTIVVDATAVHTRTVPSLAENASAAASAEAIDEAATTAVTEPPTSNNNAENPQA
ncbi:PREDICTED: mucin-7 [Rhagoletis zephyria]|uniref:mucin-7 n=1 Tax=Rhagoletis zephyria TaxID=28612 RepID=UPI000811A1B2|nr:PREDICTED: mucin-7 [Rhagoletis zephyria]